MYRKILVVLAVLAIALAVMAVSIEAQRGGGSRGSGSGGSGGGMHFEPNTNDNTNGNGNINGNFPGNYDIIEVSVSTDKQRYVLDEPIEITVTAHNPTDSAVWVDHTDPCLEPLNYLIDGYIDRYTLVDENGTRLPNTICAGDGGAYLFQPYETLTSTYTRTGGYTDAYISDFYVPAYYVPLPVGRHSVVGRIELKTGGAYESDPITIKVVESN